VKRSRGQTMVLTVIALPVFIGALGFAVDVGNLYFNRTKLQTADDAAVLAGAHCLPDEKTCAAVSTASSFATNNGVNAGEIVSGPTVGTAPDGNPDISMTLNRTVPFSFTRLVGILQAPVQVAATAEIGPANEVFNALRVGLQYCLLGMASPCPYSVGATTVTFAAKKNDIGSGWTTGPGDWSRLRLPNVTASNTVSTCVPPTATCVDSFPGWNNTRAVVDEASSLIGQDVVVPLVDWTGCTGSCNLNVYGFADIKVTGAVDSGPNSSYITGIFENYVNPGNIGPGGTDVGSFAEKLID